MLKKSVFQRINNFISFTSAPSLNSIPMSCNSMSNQECKTRPQVLMEMILCFLHLVLKTSKCRGSCNNINYPYKKLVFLILQKKLNVKVFNLMSRTNETRYI